MRPSTSFLVVSLMLAAQPAFSATDAAKPDVSKFTQCRIESRKEILSDALSDSVPDLLVCDEKVVARGDLSADWAVWLTSGPNHFVEGPCDTRVDYDRDHNRGPINQTVVNIRTFSRKDAPPQAVSATEH